MTQIGKLEIFLIEFALFLGLWLVYDYLAALLTAIFVPICTFILLIAWIAEYIEPSRVPASYFKLMGISILALWPQRECIIFFFYKSLNILRARRLKLSLIRVLSIKLLLEASLGASR